MATAAAHAFGFGPSSALGALTSPAGAWRVHQPPALAARARARPSSPPAAAAADAHSLSALSGEEKALTAPFRTLQLERHVQVRTRARPTVRRRLPQPPPAAQTLQSCGEAVSFADAYLQDTGCTAVCRELARLEQEGRQPAVRESRETERENERKCQVCARQIHTLDFRGNDIRADGAREIAVLIATSKTLRTYVYRALRTRSRAPVWTRMRAPPRSRCAHAWTRVPRTAHAPPPS